MITGNDARPDEEPLPNFNEWGNPLFLPNNGETRASDPGYSMAYRPTSVPFRHIEDIVSRLEKVNAVKGGRAVKDGGSPQLPPAQPGPALAEDSSNDASPDTIPRLPHDRAGSPAGATDLASGYPMHSTPPIVRRRRSSQHADLATIPRLRSHSAFDSSPLLTQSSGPVEPPPRQRLSIRQSIQALAVGTANSLRRSTRNPPQPSTTLSFEDAVHATCFNCSTNSYKKPVIPIPVVPRRRPRKRLWRQCHTWRGHGGIDEPVRSSSMGAIASPSSMCMDDMSSFAHGASRSFLNTPSPGHPSGRDLLARTRELTLASPLHDSSKHALTRDSVDSNSAQLVAVSPRAPPSPSPEREPELAAPEAPDPPAAASPEHGLLPPPPDVPIPAHARGSSAFDSYGSQSRGCQLLQVASGPPHSTATEVPSGRCDSGAAAAAPGDGTAVLPHPDSICGDLGPTDSIDLGPTSALHLYGSETSGELLGGVSGRRVGGSAPVAAQMSGADSPPREGSPGRGRKFSLARRPSPAALQRARLPDDFQSPRLARGPSAPLSPAQARLSVSSSEELRQPRRALSQDTWTRVHASGVWHGQTLATLNHLATEWQTIKQSLVNSRTSPHGSASPASRRSLLSEHRAQMYGSAASKVGRPARSHSLSAGGVPRPPHLPVAAPARRCGTPPAAPAFRRPAMRKARSRSGSAKAIDPKTTPFSPSVPLPAPQEKAPPQGSPQPSTNSARLHARRLAAIRAGLRGPLPDEHAAGAAATDADTAEIATAHSDVLPQTRRPLDSRDIRSGNTASRRIGRDPRPRAERAQHAAAADPPSQSAPLRAGAAGAMPGSAPTSPSPQPSPSATAQRAAQRAADAETKGSRSPSLAGPSGSLSRLGGGASTLGLLANRRQGARRSCSPKVGGGGGGGPPVRRTGPYSHGNGNRGAGRGKHSGPRSVPARVSVVWR